MLGKKSQTPYTLHQLEVSLLSKGFQKAEPLDESDKDVVSYIRGMNAVTVTDEYCILQINGREIVFARNDLSKIPALFR